MSAKLEKTRTPGVYKRGGRYVVVYYVEGKQRRESAPNFEVARKLKAAREADVARGEFHEQSRTSFAAYATEWVERYQGRGRALASRRATTTEATSRATRFRGSDRQRDSRRSLRETSRIHRLAVRRVGPGEARGQTPSRYRPSPSGRRQKRLSDSSVANSSSRSAPARNGGRRGSAPPEPCARCADAASAVGGDLEPDEIRALSREQLAAFLGVVHPKHRTLFRFLASTGLRVSEVAALQWCHLRLDGAKPHVRVRRQLYRGRLQPPKSRHGRRDVPLDHRMVVELRTRRGETSWPSDEDLVFANEAGGPIDKDNLRRRHSDRPQRRREPRGRRFTRSVIHARRCSLSAARASSRSSGGSGTIPRRSR